MSDFKLRKKEKLDELKEKLELLAKNNNTSGVAVCIAEINAVIQQTEDEKKGIKYVISAS